MLITIQTPYLYSVSIQHDFSDICLEKYLNCALYTNHRIFSFGTTAINKTKKFLESFLCTNMTCK